MSRHILLSLSDRQALTGTKEAATSGCPMQNGQMDRAKDLRMGRGPMEGGLSPLAIEWVKFVMEEM